MRIHIVTVFNSRNFGSYLQSVSLKKVLEQYGDVDFVDTKSRNTKRDLQRELYDNLTHLRLRRSFFDYRQTRAFLRAQSSMPTITMEKALQNKNDIYVFGSDEIWNISRNDFSAFPQFWGRGFEGCFKISYAPSINSSTSKQLSDFGAEKYLKGFSSLSARDVYTKTILSEFTDKDISLVLDPTMLMDKEYYLSNYKADMVPFDKYIAVYCYLRQSDPKVAAIKKLAKQLDLKLVSVGLYNRWCDYCMPAYNINPFIYYDKADYVVSDTFHGIAFALIFGKQFVAVSDGKRKKVLSMLDQFDLNQRVFLDGDVDSLTRIISSQIDYSKVNEVLNSYRTASNEYICSAIRGCI